MGGGLIVAKTLAQMREQSLIERMKKDWFYQLCAEWDKANDANPFSEDCERLGYLTKLVFHDLLKPYEEQEKVYGYYRKTKI